MQSPKQIKHSERFNFITLGKTFHKSRQLKEANIGVCTIEIASTEYWPFLTNAIVQIIAVFLYAMIKLSALRVPQI